MSGKNDRQRRAGGDGSAACAHHNAQSYYSTSAAVFNVQGKVVGHITPDGWLRKRVDPAIHMLRRPPGWATDVTHLDLPIRGIRLVTPDGTTYEAGLELFRRHGIRIERGYGQQVVLPLSFWTVRRADQPEQLPLLSLEVMP